MWRERIRVRRPLTFLAQCHAAVELLAGDAESAEKVLRPALDLAVEIHDQDQAAQIAAQLSLLLSTRGAADEAEGLAALAAVRAPAESVTAQTLAWTARASVLRVQRNATEAAQLARSALDIVPAEMLNLRGEIVVGLSRTLVAVGDRPGARTALSDAATLYQRKGNRVAAKRARELSKQIAGT